jgi:hypothetical protein
MVLPHTVFGQSAKEAIRALKKLEARVQVGISYRDYAPALGDAQFEVNLFLESPEAKSKSELSQSIKKAMELYLQANTIWGEKVKLSLPYELQEKFDKAITTYWEHASEELKKATSLLQH